MRDPAGTRASSCPPRRLAKPRGRTHGVRHRHHRRIRRGPGGFRNGQGQRRACHHAARRPVRLPHNRFLRRGGWSGSAVDHRGHRHRRFRHPARRGCARGRARAGVPARLRPRHQPHRSTRLPRRPRTARPRQTTAERIRGGGPNRLRHSAVRRSVPELRDHSRKTARRAGRTGDRNGGRRRCAGV